MRSATVSGKVVSQKWPSRWTEALPGHRAGQARPRCSLHTCDGDESRLKAAGAVTAAAHTPGPGIWLVYGNSDPLAVLTLGFHGCG